MSEVNRLLMLKGRAEKIGKHKDGIGPAPSEAMGQSPRLHRPKRPSAACTVLHYRELQKHIQFLEAPNAPGKVVCKNTGFIPLLFTKHHLPGWSGKTMV